MALPCAAAAAAALDAAPASAPPAAPLPRFVLRKRTVSHGADGDEGGAEAWEPPLPAVTSAFLSGLFADVAQASEAGAPPPASEGAPRPLKKSRLSLHRSLSRCGRSFRDLSGLATSSSAAAEAPSCAAAATSASPTGVADAHFLSFAAEPEAVPLIPELRKHRSAASSASSVAHCDSLHFQLCSLIGASPGADPGPPGAPAHAKADALFASPSRITLHSLFQAGQLAFPHLPAAVSDSSYSEDGRAATSALLTRNLSDLQSSLRETLTFPSLDKEPAYGWFVVVDPDDDEPASSRYSATLRSASSESDLAFVAPTAPLATNHDDEVEWAKAADTVDDVLGDFF